MLNTDGFSQIYRQYNRSKNISRQLRIIKVLKIHSLLTFGYISCNTCADLEGPPLPQLAISILLNSFSKIPENRHWNPPPPPVT